MQIFCHLLIRSVLISENKVTNVDSLKDSELEDARKSLVQTIGENIQIRRVITSDFDNGNECWSLSSF